jgi:hypothetical protein
MDVGASVDGLPDPQIFDPHIVTHGGEREQLEGICGAIICVISRSW